MRELRCSGNILHALVEEEPEPRGIVEFRCKSRFCGKAPGNVVLHRFDLETGAVHTRRYKDTPQLDRSAYDTGKPHPAVRSA